jgi:hypothetical protein
MLRHRWKGSNIARRMENYSLNTAKMFPDDATQMGSTSVTR